MFLCLHMEHKVYLFKKIKMRCLENINHFCLEKSTNTDKTNLCLQSVIPLQQKI